MQYHTSVLRPTHSLPPHNAHSRLHTTHSCKQPQEALLQRQAGVRGGTGGQAGARVQDEQVCGPRGLEGLRVEEFEFFEPSVSVFSLCMFEQASAGGLCRLAFTA